MDFFSFTVGELTIAQFTFLSILYLLLAGLILCFMDAICFFISDFLKGIFKHDKNR